MECRSNCAICCIAISISSPIPGMPNGKAAGTPCVQLNAKLGCMIFGKPERPQTCINFKAEREFCGDTDKEALQILTDLENA